MCWFEYSSILPVDREFLFKRRKVNYKYTELPCRFYSFLFFNFFSFSKPPKGKVKKPGKYIPKVKNKLISDK